MTTEMCAAEHLLDKDPCLPNTGLSGRSEESSLDAFMRSPKVDDVGPSSSKSELRPDGRRSSSPFSVLFPSSFLEENGVCMAAAEAKAEPRKEAPFACPHCAFTSAAWHELVVHKRQHLGTKVHLCSQCGAGFTRPASLKKHVASRHDAPPLRCPVAGCAFQPRNLNSLRSHQKSHRAIEQMESYYCKLCKRLYSDRSALLNHITHTHASNGGAFGKLDMQESAAPKEVPLPSAAAPSAEAVGEALPKSPSSPNRMATAEPVAEDDVAPSPAPIETKEDESKSSLECNKCTYTTRTFAALYSHKKRQHSEQDGNASSSKLGCCMYCWKKFPNPDRLMAHIRSAHIAPKAKAKAQSRKPTLKCQKCEFTTTTKRVFTAHNVMHTKQAAATERVENETSPRRKRRSSTHSSAASTSSEVRTSATASPSGRTLRVRPMVQRPSPPSSVGAGPSRASASSRVLRLLGPPPPSSPLLLQSLQALQGANVALAEALTARDGELGALKAAALRLVQLVAPEDGGVDESPQVHAAVDELLSCLEA